jgi:RND family efflux transporter MFP subunit
MPSRFLLSTVLFISQPLSAAPREVQVAIFSELAQARTYQDPARVINLMQADIATESQGRIVNFPVQVGDQVEQGQLLVELDCTTAHANLKRMHAALKRLQATRQLNEQQLKRAESLLDSRSISREELDQRQTQLEADNASIEEQRALIDTAEQTVSDCRLNAPYAGTIIAKLSNEGAYASPGSPMVTLLHQGKVELETELPVRQVEIIRHSPSINFIADQQRYRVTIRTILPIVDSQSRQQKIRLSFAGDRRPSGGSFGLLQYDSDRVYLEQQYIQKRNGQFGIFIVNNNQARFIALPGAAEGQAVHANLDAEDLVIVSDLKLLQPGEPIKASK